MSVNPSAVRHDDGMVNPLWAGKPWMIQPHAKHQRDDLCKGSLSCCQAAQNLCFIAGSRFYFDAQIELHILRFGNTFEIKSLHKIILHNLLLQVQYVWGSCRPLNGGLEVRFPGWAAC